MPRTFGGLYFCGAGSITPSAVGAAAGQYALALDANNIPFWGNTAGAATVTFVADLANLTRPYITYPANPGQYSTSAGVLQNSNEFLQIFGNNTGTPGNPMGGQAAGSTTATPTATLPTSQFGTPASPWGMSVKDIFVVYSVQTATLTSATVGLYRVTFSNNVAYAFANPVPTAQLTLPLTATTTALTPYVQATTVLQPLNFESIDYSCLNLELVIAAAATSAVRVYGMGMHVVTCYT